MASAMYSHNREEALSAIASGVLKVIGVSNGYTFSAAHTSPNDIASGRIVTSNNQLASVTITDGVLDAADLTLTAVTGSSAIAAFIVYTVAGTSASSTMHVYIDSAASGLPVTPNGGDIVISWDSGANKIYKL